VADSPYTVSPLSAATLSRFAHFRLHRSIKAGRTGVLMHGLIRTPLGSTSPEAPTVTIAEDGRTLAAFTSYYHLPRWANLPPGEHKLLFLALRPATRSSFHKRVTLRQGDVLVAICDPIQPAAFFAERPAADTWYLGIVNAVTGLDVGEQAGRGLNRR
jgi:hypothetical protein